MARRDLLDEVMPENTGGIFQNANKHANFRSLILYCRTRMALLDTKKLTQFTEASEPPITLLRNETMVRICNTVSQAC